MLNVRSKDQTGMKRVFDGYERMPKNDIRSLYVELTASSDRAFHGQNLL